MKVLRGLMKWSDVTPDTELGRMRFSAELSLGMSNGKGKPDAYFFRGYFFI